MNAERNPEAPTSFAPKDLDVDGAICAVMAEVTRLEKAGINAFDKYNFTSIDDFKDHLRPLLAKHDLNVSISEAGVETFTVENKKGENKFTCKITYEITLRWCGVVLAPERATVILPYTGAQTAGIAKSYAIKEWIKGRFLASSGDIAEEADTRRQDDLGSQSLPKKEARPLYEALQKEMREVAAETNSDAMLQWALENRENLMKLPKEWQDEIREEYVKTSETIKAQEKIDGAK